MSGVTQGGVTQGDRWMVSIGGWHFGPLTFDEAVSFENEHGGKRFPLWLPGEVPMGFSGELALVIAKREAERV